MSKKITRICLAVFSAAFFFSSVSCRRSGAVASINEKQLFSINYGSFEDELNLFNLSTYGSINTCMTMHDGFFYIANGESKKILELNSYGELLTLYYNGEYTKAPSFADEDSTNSTKKAVEYPFNTLGPLAVDSKKCLYAVDTLPPERQENDLENRLLLNYIVLRFNSDGSFIDYLGQQGPGGTPFPFIRNIYATKNNELVVVCESNEGPLVYWFNEAGFLLYSVSLNDRLVPKLKNNGDSENSAFISIENVIPDNISRRLYVQVNYFQNYLDPATKVQSGVDFEKTMLYPLNVETGVYEEGLDIPPHEETVSENLSKEVFFIPFDFLGITDGGWFFFYVPTEKGYLIQMVQPNGQKILKRSLPVDHGEILYHSLCLSGNGIISALYIKKDKADILWWRTDALVSSFMN
ncbi:hypothetical protein [uncultured Treponema sp.]|uniref:LIC_12708 family protein n=1 Tax=uncultured Treponema sp. TaxID=162155 RepID=UPI0015BE7061|nr:hypothetical protein [uncultured Treponema sp.]